MSNLIKKKNIVLIALASLFLAFIPFLYFFIIGTQPTNIPSNWFINTITYILSLPSIISTYIAYIFVHDPMDPEDLGVAMWSYFLSPIVGLIFWFSIIYFFTYVFKKLGYIKRAH